MTPRIFLVELRGVEPLASAVRKRRSPDVSYSPSILPRVTEGTRTPSPWATTRCAGLYTTVTIPWNEVHSRGFEPPTSRLSGERSAKAELRVRRDGGI